MLYGYFKNTIRFFSKRVFVLYFIVAVLASLIFDCELILRRARMKALDRVRPDKFDYLLLLEKGTRVDEKKLEEYTFFYEKNVEYLPNAADRYGMLGFCYYHLGQHEKALEIYKEASLLTNIFFGFHYNMGVIYFKQGDYSNAAKALEMLTRASMAKNIELVMSSRALRPFLAGKTGTANDVVERLRTTFTNGYKLLVIIKFRKQDYLSVIGYATQALILELPEEDFFLYYLGRAAYERGLYEKAIGILQDAVEINPDHIAATHYLGLSIKAFGLEQMGDGILLRADQLREEIGETEPEESSIDVRIF